MGLLNVGQIIALSLGLGALSAVPIVDLDYAQYQGAVDTTLNVTRFLGIRYAAAPVGNLRWAAPQAPPMVSGIQEAISLPNTCVQSGPGGSSFNPFNPTKKRDVGQSEDCLFLNVYIPGPTVGAVQSRGLPAIVWVHGGGYHSLSASSYDGSSLVFQSRNSAIVVVIQYRLGLFGFLSGTAVKAGGALNAGLLDQQFALQWVQAHIAKFGGDPSKITIWGQSAGAGSILQHIVANDGNTQPPLFTNAITSSPYLPPQYNYNDRIPEMVYKQVLSAVGCPLSTDTLSCLRNASTSTLSSANSLIESNGFYAATTFGPVVDGTYIIEQPTVTLGRGKHNGQALYAVTNLNEGTLLVQQSLTINASQYIRELFPTIRASEADSLAALYADFGTNIDQAIAIMGEMTIVCPTYYLMRAFGNNAWKGEFAIQPATHGFDIGYYFTTSTVPIVAAFTGRFFEMVTSGHIDDNYWASDNAEIVFALASDGSADVYLTMTDSGLLNRCGAWFEAVADASQ